MEEKRLERLMMLQIHRSDTPSIDAVIDRFATTAARRFNFFNANIIHVPVYTVQYSRQFLKYRHFKYIIPNHINKTRNISLVIHFTCPFWLPQFLILATPMAVGSMVPVMRAVLSLLQLLL